MATTITIQYLPGCPNRALAEARVEEVLRRIGDPRPEMVVEEIADEDAARRVGFHGSPTILVDGLDPFAVPAAPAVFACRVYRTDGATDGAPPAEQLYAVLAGAGRPQGNGATAEVDGTG